MITIRAPRLDLIASEREHLQIEIDAPERLGEALSCHVPEGWPPGLYDRDAAVFFLQKTEELGAAARGWFGWYAVLRDDRAPESTQPTTAPEGAESRRVLVGSIGYFGPPDGSGVVEIGYSVVASYRGRGFATEMVAALVERALSTPGVTGVVAESHATNIASHKVLERAGFEKIGAGREPEDIRFRYVEARSSGHKVASD